MSSLSINANSIALAFSKADLLAVYGWKHCEYKKIHELLSARYQKVFQCQMLGNPQISADASTTCEGRRLTIFDPVAKDLSSSNSTPLRDGEDIRYIARICKTGLINILLENYKRTLEKTPLIPLIFIVDISDNPYPVGQASDFFSDAPYVTHQEFRRCYKMFKLKDDPDPDLQQMAEIAKEIIQFIKLEVSGDLGSCVLLPAFYQEDKWDQASSDRRQRKCKVVSEPSRWKVLLTQHAREFKEIHQAKMDLIHRVQDDESVLEEVPRFNNDVQFMTLVIRANRKACRFIGAEISADREALRQLMKEEPSVLEFAHPELLRNADFMLSLSLAFSPKKVLRKLMQFFPDEIQLQQTVRDGSFKQIARKILEELQHPIIYAAKELLNDKDFMLKLLNLSHHHLEKAATLPFVYLSEELASDQNFMLTALEKSELAIGVASPSLLDDEKFMLQVVAKDPNDLQFGSPRIQELLS
ncbi:MAG: DUF4116 domain-containing protein [Chlamydiales bacterium]